MRSSWIILLACSCLFAALGCGSASDTSADARVQPDGSSPPDAQQPPDALVADAATPDATPPRCDPSAAFSPAIPVDSLNLEGVSEEGARLSPDELTIYFSSNREGGVGGWDIYVATRESLGDPWGTPVLLPGVNTTGVERYPMVTDDGLFLYADTRDTNYDLSVAQRESVDADFGALSPVAELNAGADDIDAWILPDHNAAYFGSNRGGNYDLYRATRTDAFATPVAVNSVDVNTEAYEGGPVVTPDEKTIFFSSDREGGLGSFDIYVATRDSTADPYGAAEGLDEVNSGDYDAATWISADGCVLYLTRNVGLTAPDYEIYMAMRGQ